MDVLNHLLSVIPSNLPAAAIVVEFGLRLFPSDQPKSILLGISNALHVVAEIVQKLDGLVDGIVPQNLKK